MALTVATMLLARTLPDGGSPAGWFVAAAVRTPESVAPVLPYLAVGALLTLGMWAFTVAAVRRRRRRRTEKLDD